MLRGWLVNSVITTLLASFILDLVILIDANEILPSVCTVSLYLTV